MTGAELDMLNDRISSSAWNEINAPDPADKSMKAAAAEMKKAVDLLNKAAVSLVAAAREVNGFPMEDRILSFSDQTDDLRVDLAALMKKYERGERE